MIGERKRMAGQQMETSDAAFGIQKILIAPAAFKGTLSAQAAAGIMKNALQAAFPLAESAGTLPEAAAAEAMRLEKQNTHPDLQMDICPIADGGDDTLSVLQASDAGFERHTAEVTGPVPGMRVRADYLIHRTKKLAVIEAAQAHGLKLLMARGALQPAQPATSVPASRPTEALAPMTATSYGVGELIQEAMETAKRDGLALETLVITVGGSASTDGGLGALQALGVRFFDATGKLIVTPIGGGDLARIQAVEWPGTWRSKLSADETHTSQKNPVASEIASFKGNILIATDVISPLLGPEGTAAVFAPQKGASPAQCDILEKGLHHVAGLMRAETDQDWAALPGAGAAGGLSWGLRHLPGSRLVSGAGWIAEALNLPARIQAADVIFTGEGRLDATSLAGKGTGQLLNLAKGKPVFVFCGQAQAGLTLPGNVHVFPLANMPEEAAQAAMQDPAAFLRQRVLEAAPEIR